MGYPFPQVLYGYHAMQDILYNNAKGVTEKEMLEGPEEAFIDFSEDKRGEFKILVKNLLKTDPEVAKRVKNITRDKLNYLKIFLDTISVERVFRRMKYMLSWLREHHYSKK
jgi:hypothetical protein